MRNHEFSMVTVAVNIVPAWLCVSVTFWPLMLSSTMNSAGLPLMKLIFTIAFPIIPGEVMVKAGSPTTPPGLGPAAYQNEYKLLHSTTVTMSCHCKPIIILHARM